MAKPQHLPTQAPDRQQRNRVRVAQEAARLISEHGLRDFHQASLKAAQRLGIADKQALPRHQEIEQALREHQRLFQAHSQPHSLHQRRQAAVQAMRFLARFEPRLVGSVLDGTANAHASIALQVFHDSPEMLDLFLREQGIPGQWRSHRFRTAAGGVEVYPQIGFVADQLEFELTILPLSSRRQSELLGPDGRPMARASLTQVLALLSAEGGNHG